jgi:dipeptidyl aminopeptidase/acylaminoacyl peptidase
VVFVLVDDQFGGDLLLSDADVQLLGLGGRTAPVVLARRDEKRRFDLAAVGDRRDIPVRFGLPWENVETYRDISSITDVGEIETPLLVTAGEDDWRCPPTQAEQLYVSVRKQGVPAKLVVYQDEHHDVGDPERAIHRLEALLDWFERHDPTTEGGDAGAES